MSRQWKPGDVARVTFKAMPLGGMFGPKDDPLVPGTFIAVALPSKHGDGGVVWWSSGGGGAHASRSDCVEDARPLVVIDPEDGAQTDALRDALRRHGADLNSANVYGALREFADPAPPKPDEPTGLGAVVEDAAGDRWVRFAIDGGDEWTDGATGNRGYDDIDAVRVLSEGVTVE